MKGWLLFGLIAIFSALAARDRFLGEIVVDFGTPLKSTTALLKPYFNKDDSSPIVTHIVDGDTVVVIVDGVSEKVRLIGVDTPETVDPRKPVQCFGREASAFTKLLLLNKSIRLERDISQGDRDKYGRLLRYVFLTDGTIINQKIIAEGYGHEYTYRTPYRYRDDFKNAERSARESQKGLWASGACGL